MVTGEGVVGTAESKVGETGLTSILRDGEISDPTRVITIVPVLASASDPFIDRDWGVRDNFGVWW